MMPSSGLVRCVRPGGDLEAEKLDSPELLLVFLWPIGVQERSDMGEAALETALNDKKNTYFKHSSLLFA